MLTDKIERALVPHHWGVGYKFFSPPVVGSALTVFLLHVPADHCEHSLDLEHTSKRFQPCDRLKQVLLPEPIAVKMTPAHTFVL